MAENTEWLALKLIVHDLETDHWADSLYGSIKGFEAGFAARNRMNDAAKAADLPVHYYVVPHDFDTDACMNNSDRFNEPCLAPKGL